MCERSRHRRFLPHAVVLGLLSLGWLILRTGKKPTRLSYPCQQAAFGHVSLLLGAPLAHYLRRAMLGRAVRTDLVLATLATVALVATVALSGFGRADSLRTRDPWSSRAVLGAGPGYQATLYVVNEAGGPSGDHHLGVDELIACMGAGGLRFYESPTTTPESGPDGVVGANDVVLIKINQQWPERGGTNTDVLRGLLARIVEHPDGFTGEIVIVENTQGAGTFDWANANAENTAQSAQDVVDYFAGLGHAASTFRWDDLRTTSVGEYSEGDDDDGYVVGPLLPETSIRVSYPKFLSAGGHRVSLAHGIWAPGSGTYDDERLTFLNVPVLKSHAAVYGVTACTKNHVGSMTTALTTNTHAAVRFGGLGSFLADVRMADLNILDCIYILADPNGGPWCTYAEATRVDKLVAGVDPVALDMWATVNILIPTMIDNGHTVYPMQDPENPGSVFRTYLDRTMTELVDAGIEVTNDTSQIVAMSCADVGVDPEPSRPVQHGSAYPNPFLSGTTIRFDTSLAGDVELEVYDVSGRRVRTVRQFLAAGEGREMHWSGTNDAGERLPAGSYYWRVNGAGASLRGKVTLLR